LLPAAETRGITTVVSSQALQSTVELAGLDSVESWAVICVPDMHGPRRGVLLSTFAGRHAIVGPSRPWLGVQASYGRAVRARHLLVDGAEALDTDEHLVLLVLGADQDAADDLRRRALAPLAALRPNAAERLAETLRSWLLHQGQRDAVAADLFVHAQTVRYRMNQLRELYGERLNDPTGILELTVALGLPGTGSPRSGSAASRVDR